MSKRTSVKRTRREIRKLQAKHGHPSRRTLDRMRREEVRDADRGPRSPTR